VSELNGLSLELLWVACPKVRPRSLFSGGFPEAKPSNLASKLSGSTKPGQVHPSRDTGIVDSQSIKTTGVGGEERG